MQLKLQAKIYHPLEEKADDNDLITQAIISKFLSQIDEPHEIEYLFLKHRQLVHSHLPQVHN